MRWDCGLHAAFAFCAIPAIAPPTSIVPGVDSIGIRWNHHGCARVADGAETAVTGPGGSVRREIRVRRNAYGDALSGGLTIAAIALPTGTVAARARVVGNRGSRALCMRIDLQHADEHCCGANDQASDCGSSQATLVERSKLDSARFASI